MLRAFSPAPSSSTSPRGPSTSSWATGPPSPIRWRSRSREWEGSARVLAKYVEPAWSAPQMVRRDHSGLPHFIPGGAPNNPMGARAILLDRDEIAIHETTRAMRASIGTGASYGCIRMLNEDVIDLYDRVAVGASVTMTK